MVSGKKTLIGYTDCRQLPLVLLPVRVACSAWKTLANSRRRFEEGVTDHSMYGMKT